MLHRKLSAPRGVDPALALFTREASMELPVRSDRFFGLWTVMSLVIAQIPLLLSEYLLFMAFTMPSRRILDGCAVRSMYGLRGSWVELGLRVTSHVLSCSRSAGDAGVGPT